MISRFSVALLTAVRLCAGAEFYPDVASIIHRHCVGCHQPGQSAPFPLLSYNDVAKRGEFIAEVTRIRYMPCRPGCPNPATASSSMRDD